MAYIERPEGTYITDADGWDAGFMPREAQDYSIHREELAIARERAVCPIRFHSCLTCHEPFPVWPEHTHDCIHGCEQVA